MNFVLENPKLLITAISGIVLYFLKAYVFKDSFTPEMSEWINIILSSVVLALLGYFKRVTKSEAVVLEKISDNKNQL